MICRNAVSITVAVCAIACVAAGQASQKKQSLMVNGHTGEAIVYQIDGRSYIDLETLVRIGNGSMSFRADQIILSFPVDSASSQVTSASEKTGMSSEFQRNAVNELANIKEWVSVLVYAAQRGIPGDGSRLVMIHDRASESLRLAQVAATTRDDQSALQLLTSNFNELKKWNDKLVHERKSMDTGKYSMSPEAINNDPAYQKIANCTKFLANMIPSGRFADDSSCH